jgi:hypothetical protein
MNWASAIALVDLGFGAGETNRLLAADVALMPDPAFIEHRKGDVLFQLSMAAKNWFSRRFDGSKSRTRGPGVFYARVERQNTPPY